ncbi:hypothetical protein [Hahella sp. KA22]|uniref:hypothetical protein n=1 Tax=Hahella sp. KA22 TaxID=1628392 RepID=UPI0013E31C01|nr:hypothetical protein [Hahella sp. KA22]
MARRCSRQLLNHTNQIRNHLQHVHATAAYSDGRRLDGHGCAGFQFDDLRLNLPGRACDIGMASLNVYSFVGAGLRVAVADRCGARAARGGAVVALDCRLSVTGDGLVKVGGGGQVQVIRRR